MSDIYDYTSRGRNAKNVAIIVLAVVATGAGVAFTADPLITLVFISIVVGIGVVLLINPRGGLRIDSESLTLLRGKTERRIPLSDIDHVEIQSWSDSTDVRAHLTSGERLPLPDTARPSSAVLETELTRRGVKVKRT